MQNAKLGNDPECELNDVGAVSVGIREEHDVATAFWTARAMALSVGLSQVGVYSVATAVSELANNIFFHGSGGGTITLTELRNDGRVGIEVVAEDEGPGIADIGLAMQDGYTTNGGLGGGLPGVERLMDEFEISSHIGAGTRVVTKKWGINDRRSSG